MNAPSLDLWLREARADPAAPLCGMYLFHNGVVRATAKARVRQQDPQAAPVRGMEFSYDEALADCYVRRTLAMPGIGYVRLWLNRGTLAVGDDLMLVLVGGDIRPHVVEALEFLVQNLKDHCVQERELF